MKTLNSSRVRRQVNLPKGQTALRSGLVQMRRVISTAVFSLSFMGAASAATYTVTTASDKDNAATQYACTHGQLCSLRDAIKLVNAKASCSSSVTGVDNIVFQIPTSPMTAGTVKYYRIAVGLNAAGLSLPQIRCPVNIAGPNIGNGAKIELNGLQATSIDPTWDVVDSGNNTPTDVQAYALQFVQFGSQDASGSSVKNLVMNQFLAGGVAILGANNVTVATNNFGIDVRGKNGVLNLSTDQRDRTVLLSPSQNTRVQNNVFGNCRDACILMSSPSTNSAGNFITGNTIGLSLDKKTILTNVNTGNPAEGANTGIFDFAFNLFYGSGANTISGNTVVARNGIEGLFTLGDTVSNNYVLSTYNASDYSATNQFAGGDGALQFVFDGNSQITNNTFGKLPLGVGVNNIAQVAPGGKYAMATVMASFGVGYPLGSTVFSGNTIENTTNGKPALSANANVNFGGGSLIVSGNTIQNNSGVGVIISSSNADTVGNNMGVVITDNTIRNNNGGVLVEPGRANGCPADASLIPPLGVNGTLWMGSYPQSATLSVNSIYNNASGGHLGIDLSAPIPFSNSADVFSYTSCDGGFWTVVGTVAPNGDGVTANDPLDADFVGPNGMQNYPVLSGSSFINPEKAKVVGYLDSEPNTEYVIEVFANPVLGPSGHGEGRIYMGQKTVKTNAAGHVDFKIEADENSPVVYNIRKGVCLAAPYLTATATNLLGGATSEFSKSVLANVNGNAKAYAKRCAEVRFRHCDDDSDDNEHRHDRDHDHD